MGQRWVAALALALAGPVAGQVPEAVPRPEARAVAEAPARPEARPQAADAGRLSIAVAAPPDGAPSALAVPPPTPVEPTADILAVPAADAPALPRRVAPALWGEAEPPPPPAGLGWVALAGAGAIDPSAVPVVVDGWAGLAPPVRAAAAPPAPAAVLPPADARPRARPGRAAIAAPDLPAEPEAMPAQAPGARPGPLLIGPEFTVLAVATAVVPRPRPEGITVRATEARAQAVRGQVCGNPAIQGETVGAVGGGGACSIDGPVLVRSVDGVRMAGEVTVDCATAEALLAWVRDGARPALAGRGGGLAAVEVMGSYACRPRNNQAGARLSEHGRGRAVDIGGLRLADGSRLSVLEDWPDGALRAMHDAACGPFSTVLGPDANAQHRNHFHFDTARGRGPYCR